MSDQHEDINNLYTTMHCTNDNNTHCVSVVCLYIYASYIWGYFRESRMFGSHLIMLLAGRLLVVLQLSCLILLLLMLLLPMSLKTMLVLQWIKMVTYMSLEEAPMVTLVIQSIIRQTMAKHGQVMLVRISLVRIMPYVSLILTIISILLLERPEPQVMELPMMSDIRNITHDID